MTERDQVRKSIKTIFIHNLKAAKSIAEVPDKYKGALAAVLTMADYINETSPVVLRNHYFSKLADFLEENDKDKLHPIEFLDCSDKLKDYLHDMGAENLEDIEAHTILNDAIYIWVKGTAKEALSFSDSLLDELQKVYRNTLGKDFEIH